MAIALAAGATFVARSFTGDPKHVAAMIVEGMKHRGYALIDVLQPCVTFNRVNTYEWYRQRAYHVEDEDYDPSDREAAWSKAQEWGPRIPIGIVYRSEGLPSCEDQITALAEGNPVSRLHELAHGGRREYSELVDRFR
jgi:2-oxoglutarate ferredoxin oxidoreductase subunit beta